MNRIESIFLNNKEQGRKAVMPYITAGDPNIDFTGSLIRKIADAGADIIEVGVPFSDPMADGPTVQLACERALSSGTTIMDVLAMIKSFRAENDQTGIVLMGYANPVEAIGQDRYIDLAKDAGVDAILVVDYPPEESKEFAQKVVAAGLAPIFLVAPTTTDERLPEFSELGRGFLYYVSFKGVTGAAHLDVDDVKKNVDRLHKNSPLPVAVGFGIRDAQSASAIAKFAEGVVIGSALVKKIEDNTDNLNVAESEIVNVVTEIRQALDNNK